MKKKLFSLALALALCLGLTVPAFAAELKVVEVPATVVEHEGNPNSFHDGLARMVVTGEDGQKKTCFVDKAGKVVIPPEYDEAWEFHEGFAQVRKGDKFGFIDTTGKVVVPFRYPWAEIESAKSRPLEDFYEGMARVQKDGKYGFVDTTGEEVIPCQYDMAYSFSEGLAAVCVNGKGWAFIDKTGKEVLPSQYSGARSFSEGLAAVQKNGKWGFIDKTGKEVISLRSSQYDDISYFSEGMARVEKDGKYGYIDKTGKLVIPCKYDFAVAFSEGFAMAFNYYYDDRPPMPQRRPATGIIDRTGREIIPAGVYTEDGEKYILIWPGMDYAYFRDGRSDGMIKMCLSDDDKGGGTYFALTVDAKVSDWAREQVDSAAVKGLMPDCLGDDFTANITRAEFAAVAVELYEAMSGDAAPAPGENPFKDTDDPVIIQANGLGIVNGKGDGVFAPNDPVTRQEAALMLSRVYTKLGGELPKVESTTFDDNDKVSGWAMDAVAFMSGREIVNGVGDNKFAPTGSASIEQALIIALRMLEKLDVE